MLLAGIQAAKGNIKGNPLYSGPYISTIVLFKKYVFYSGV